MDSGCFATNLDWDVASGRDALDSNVGQFAAMWKSAMKTVSIITASIIALLAMPLAARAQGVIGGGERGAAEGGRAAGPVGAVVGGVAGGVAGGVLGGVRGVVGAPGRHYRGYHHHYYHHHHRYYR